MLDAGRNVRRAGCGSALRQAKPTAPHCSRWASAASSRNRRMPAACFTRQLFDKESSTYTYLLTDTETRATVIIDPVLEQAERDAAIVKELELDLQLALNTHCHADHITGSHALKQAFAGLKSAISESSGCKADLHLVDGQKVTFGQSQLEVLYTPGHTDGCASFYTPAASQSQGGSGGGAVFTGDALLIRGCGRTDFQNGDSRQLYRSVHEVLFKLPPATAVFPAHDYRGRTSSSIGEEMRFNPRLVRDEDGFVEAMAALKLAFPKKMVEAVPRNKNCGV